MLPGKTIGVWSLGLVGGGGTVATGGSLIFTSAYPTGDAQLTREGFSWSPMKPRMGTDIGAEIASSSNFSSYNCFQTFFPGVEAGTNVLKGEDSKEKETKNDPLANVEVPTNVSEENKPHPVGCALVGFSYKNSDEVTKRVLVLKSEVVVKNENFGWALWSGLSRKPSSQQLGNRNFFDQDFKYRLIFLRKGEGTDLTRWSIMGGYMWSDYEFSIDGSVWNKLHAIVPGSAQDWGELMRNSSTSDGPSYKEYSGFWNVSEEGSEEIFRGIKIYGGSLESNAEILGKEDGNFKDSSYGIYGFKSVGYSYSSGEKGWLSFENQPNIKDVLNKLYAPFLGKKGKWENMQKYCSYNRYGRFLGKEDMEKLKLFCYSKKGE